MEAALRQAQTCSALTTVRRTDHRTSPSSLSTVPVAWVVAETRAPAEQGSWSAQVELPRQVEPSLPVAAPAVLAAAGGSTVRRTDHRTSPSLLSTVAVAWVVAETCLLYT